MKKILFLVIVVLFLLPVKTYSMTPPSLTIENNKENKMINGINELQFLYYKMHLPIILDIIDLILGFILCFCFLKFSNKKLCIVIEIYYSILLGGMLGYVIHRHWMMIIIGATIGVFISMLVNLMFKNGYIYFTLFIVFMKFIYLLFGFIVELFNMDFYEIFDIYPDLLNDYIAKDIGITVAIIIGLILTLIFAKKISEKLCGLLFTFIGSTQLCGILGSGPNAPFYMSGEWEDFFIPFMNIEYNDGVIYFLGIIIIMSVCIWLYKLD